MSMGLKAVPISDLHKSMVMQFRFLELVQDFIWFHNALAYLDFSRSV